ncbi:hypothetical protein HJG60_012290 [Phyllostomus discolor]|uniref:Uncharacterized protein n=1 Tax=Phyllostomus discolor TaxID=89673 RepID=A0A834DRN8_9CHIR|nr:hypothetical protein HJG60_012290 [Phyllostomus discolor]
MGKRSVGSRGWAMDSLQAGVTGGPAAVREVLLRCRNDTQLGSVYGVWSPLLWEDMALSPPGWALGSGPALGEDAPAELRCRNQRARFLELMRGRGSALGRPRGPAARQGTEVKQKKHCCIQFICFSGVSQKKKKEDNSVIFES